ncbi:hypothetical protein R3P38DRAFT_3236151 [Favolaschia claudopus]|uniref:Uncharacterized protein n=1 Tax=Favolaschia claudopus TaxID=2862362 RepID=A0AAV9ZDR8_9AGAR
MSVSVLDLGIISVPPPPRTFRPPPPLLLASPPPSRHGPELTQSPHKRRSRPLYFATPHPDLILPSAYNTPLSSPTALKLSTTTHRSADDKTHPDMNLTALNHHQQDDKASEERRVNQLLAPTVAFDLFHLSTTLPPHPSPSHCPPLLAYCVATNATTGHLALSQAPPPLRYMSPYLPQRREAVLLRLPPRLRSSPKTEAGYLLALAPAVVSSSCAFADLLPRPLSSSASTSSRPPPATCPCRTQDSWASPPRL